MKNYTELQKLSIKVETFKEQILKNGTDNLKLQNVIRDLITMQMHVYQKHYPIEEQKNQSTKPAPLAKSQAKRNKNKKT